MEPPFTDEDLRIYRDLPFDMASRMSDYSQADAKQAIDNIYFDSRDRIGIVESVLEVIKYNHIDKRELDFYTVY